MAAVGGERVATTKTHYDLRDDLAVVTMDDGKANAIDHKMLADLHACLDRAEPEAQALVLTGRAGRLSAGFDLGVMTAGPEAVRGLVTAGAEFLLRLYEFPRPVVTACSGHALAAGAILLLVSDWRIGTDGSFKIGLNEVAIRMTLPHFALELARDRLCKRHLSAAVTQATVYDPQGAVDAGFLDAVTPPDACLDAALTKARALAALPDPAFRYTKLRERGPTLARIRANLDHDMSTLAGP